MPNWEQYTLRITLKTPTVILSPPHEFEIFMFYPQKDRIALLPPEHLVKISEELVKKFEAAQIKEQLDESLDNNNYDLEPLKLLRNEIYEVFKTHTSQDRILQYIPTIGLPDLQRASKQPLKTLPYTIIQGKYKFYIPGSSIKGMLKTLIEISDPQYSNNINFSISDVFLQDEDVRVMQLSRFLGRKPLPQIVIGVNRTRLELRAKVSINPEIQESLFDILELSKEKLRNSDGYTNFGVTPRGQNTHLVRQTISHITQQPTAKGQVNFLLGFGTGKFSLPLRDTKSPRYLEISRKKTRILMGNKDSQPSHHSHLREIPSGKTIFIPARTRWGIHTGKQRYQSPGLITISFEKH